MGRNTSVALDDYFEDFVGSEVALGRYKSANEVIRGGLRFLEEENRIKILENAIMEGFDSGVATGFNHKTHLETLKAQKRKNG